MEIFNLSITATITFNCMLTYISIAGFSVAGLGYLYQYFYGGKDQDNTRVAIKIDRRGKYSYETVPDTENDAFSFLWKLALVIATIALLFIPIDLIINRG